MNTICSSSSSSTDPQATVPRAAPELVELVRVQAIARRQAAEQPLSYFQHDSPEVRLEALRLSTQPARVRAWGVAIGGVATSVVAALVLAVYRGWI